MPSCTRGTRGPDGIRCAFVAVRGEGPQVPPAGIRSAGPTGADVIRPSVRYGKTDAVGD